MSLVLDSRTRRLSSSRTNSANGAGVPPAFRPELLGVERDGLDRQQLRKLFRVVRHAAFGRGWGNVGEGEDGHSPGPVAVVFPVLGRSKVGVGGWGNGDAVQCFGCGGGLLRVDGGCW